MNYVINFQCNNDQLISRSYQDGIQPSSDSPSHDLVFYMSCVEVWSDYEPKWQVSFNVL